MAEHWIKFEPKTFEKPKVLAIRNALKMDEFAVVGRLLKLWSWADTHSIDGRDIPLTRKDIDALVKKGGFAKAMETAGWLAGNDGALTFPDFHKHNGTTAKGRAVTASRVERHRACNGPSVTDSASGNATTVTDVTLTPLTTALPEREGDKREISSSPPVCAEGAVNWAALKFDERLGWLERIAAAYGKRGKPQDVLGHIRHSIEVNGVDPAELLRCTKQATATIHQHAPQGFDSGRVPHAETFFSREQWRNPTSFAGYWDTTRRGSAPEARTAREASAALADGNSSHTLNADSLFSEPPTRHP